MQDDMKVMVAALGGIAMGIGIGLLLAPKAGREMRADLKTSIEDAEEKIEGTLSDAFTKGQKFLNEQREALATKMSGPPVA